MPAVPPVARAALPRHGFYAPGKGVVEPSELDIAADGAPIVLVVFYRAILAASDTAPIDRLMAELARRGMRPVGLFATSLKDRESDGWLRQLDHRYRARCDHQRDGVFGARRWWRSSPLDVVDAPVLQVALAGSSRELWEESDRGLSPSDLAIHVVLPELDGRLFAGVASFKQVEAADPELGYARTVHAATTAASTPSSPARRPGSRCAEPRPPTNALPSCCRPIRAAKTRWRMPSVSTRRRAPSRC